MLTDRNVLEKFLLPVSCDTTPGDLGQYFSKYGAIECVYIPKSACSFAFVTFHDLNTVRTLFSIHIVLDELVKGAGVGLLAKSVP